VKLCSGVFWMGVLDGCFGLVLLMGVLYGRFDRKNECLSQLCVRNKLFVKLAQARKRNSTVQAKVRGL